MTRKIKFRAWDNLQGGKFEYWNAKDNNYDGIFWEMIKNKSFEKPNQFTGTKDKKGKDIYEGDILKYKNETEEEKIISIEWDCGGWWTSKGDRLSNLIHNQTVIRKEQFGEESYPEIIGNIYKNPELIK